MSLFEAAENGNLQEVQRLVYRGANIHAQNDQPLVNAAFEGNLPVVEFLINRGSSSSAGYVHARDDQALINAAYWGHLRVIEFLVTRGANINVLSPELQQRYRHLLPRVINPSEYYLIEFDIIRIEILRDRTIISTKDRTYVLI